MKSRWQDYLFPPFPAIGTGRVNLIVENRTMFNSPCEKLLNVRFDWNLIFGLHINNICKNPDLKLNTLARIKPYIDFNKKRLLLNVFYVLIQLLLVSYLTSMINKLKCYKTPHKPTCTDLILTNCHRSFQRYHCHDYQISIKWLQQSWKLLIYINVTTNNFCNDIFKVSLHQIFPQNLENNFDQLVHNSLLSCNKILD